MKTIAEAREIISDLARQEGQLTFAREVLAGCWDDRSDVKSAMKDDFVPRPVDCRRPASYDSADYIRPFTGTPVTPGPYDTYAQSTIRQDNVPDGAVLLSVTSSAHEGPLKIGFLGKVQFNSEDRTTLLLQIHRDGQPVIGANARLGYDGPEEVDPSFEWLETEGGGGSLYELIKVRGEAISFISGTLALKPVVS